MRHHPEVNPEAAHTLSTTLNTPPLEARKRVPDALTQFKTLVSFDPNTYKFQLTQKFQFEFDRSARQRGKVQKHATRTSKTT